MRGTNASTPLATPKTLTPKVHFQSLGGALPHQAPRRADTGVVAQDVHRAVRLVGGVGKGLHRLDRGDVGADTDHALVAATQVGDGGVEGTRLHVGDHDLHPLGHEALGERLADAGSPAGDHGDLAVQILHPGVPLARSSATPVRATAICIMYSLVLLGQ